MPDGPGRFTQDYTCPALLRMTPTQDRLRIRGSHPLRLRFPTDSARLSPCVHGGPTTPQGPEPLRFGLFPSRSPLLGESLLFSLPAGTKMFQFPAFASVITRIRMSGLQPDGFSHSDICGSGVICTSPQLFAAYHVLHRLWEPRHPPYALFFFLVLRRHVPAHCTDAHEGTTGRGRNTLSILSVPMPPPTRARHDLLSLFLYHHVKDRCHSRMQIRRPGQRRKQAGMTKWRITDSNR